MMKSKTIFFGRFYAEALRFDIKIIVMVDTIAKKTWSHWYSWHK